MSYTSPSLAEVLANEQLMNTRLTDLRTLLRDILDDLDISYTSSNTIIELIRLLEKAYYGQVNSNSTISKVQSLFSQHVIMRNADSDDIYFSQISASPNFSFSYHPISQGTGMVTAASLMTKKSIQGYGNWTLDFDITAPSRNYENHKGMCILFNDSDTVASQSTYYGIFVGLSIDSSANIYAGSGIWSNTLVPTYSYSSSTITAGAVYHVSVVSNSGAITVTITDSSDNTVYTASYDFYNNSFYKGGYSVRFGVYADWYAYEMPLYGQAMAMKNILIDG